MKKLFLAFALLLVSSLASAQTAPLGACPMAPSALRAAYKEVLTVSSTALPFTSSVWAPTTGNPRAVCALVVVNTNSISFWADGSTPTAGSGMIIATAGSFWIGTNNMSQFLMIRVSSDASVAIQYFVPVS